MIEAYAYGTSKDLVSEKEEIKCNNIIKQYRIDSLWWCYKRKHRILSELATNFWSSIQDTNSWGFVVWIKKFGF